MTANQDAEELNHFSQYADDWWNPNGAFKSLHDINPIRLGFIQSHAYLRKQRVLDVGCGGGILTESLVAQGAETHGIDLEANAIATAKQHARDKPIQYSIASAEAYAQQYPEYFDVVTCMELLEHVPNPEQLIQACSQLLKPTGRIFFSTINRTAKSFVQAIIAAEYLLNLVPRGTHHYEKFIKPAELVSSLNQAGLQAREFQGLTYNPLTKLYKSTSNVQVNYMLFAQKNA